MERLIFEDEKNLSEKARRNIAILEILRRYGPISRPDISEKLGMNVVTISHYVDNFLKNNLVFEKQLDESEGGRRPVLLDLNPKSAYTIGVGLNLMDIVGLLIDVKGNIITKATIDRPRASVREITEYLLEAMRRVLQRSKEYVDKIKGIGVGIAGLVNKKTGSVHWPERQDDNYTYTSVNIPLRDLIENEFNLPVFIENDATVACFGEQWAELNLEAKNVLYMFSGVGCGIMIDGKIYPGTHGFAGEVAIHSYKEDELFNCGMGNPCFLKRWEIDLGIVAEIKKLLLTQRQYAPDFLRLIESKRIEDLDLKNVFTAARLKNPLAQKSLDTAAKRLGIKIAYLVNLLNPEMVVIGGGLEEAGDEFLDRINQTVRDWAFRETTQDLKIIYSKLKENAVAQGAAGLVMRQLFASL